MLNQKQFGCLKFLSVNFNGTQVCKGETSKKTHYTQLKTSWRKPTNLLTVSFHISRALGSSNIEKVLNEN